MWQPMNLGTEIGPGLANQRKPISCFALARLCCVCFAIPGYTASDTYNKDDSSIPSATRQRTLI
jgi:hypothetical protein